MNGPHRGLVAVAAVAAITFALTDVTSSSAEHGSGASLFHGHYRSTRVVKHGDPDPLVHGTRIRLRFAHHGYRDVATWVAGCNHFGARVKVQPARLQTSVVGQTLVKCSKPIMRQEAWVARFFRSDPKWSKDGPKLRLRRGHKLIKLQRRN
jgi:heat shock protein HslJ